jgi:hypothetical protein
MIGKNGSTTNCHPKDGTANWDRAPPAFILRQNKAVRWQNCLDIDSRPLKTDATIKKAQLN